MPCTNKKHEDVYIAELTDKLGK